MISITNPNHAPPDLTPGWHAALRLAFDDVDLITFPKADPHLQQMTIFQADTIVAFVLALPITVRTLVVHCKSGISRSAGVAKAVADGLGLRFPVEYKEHNRYVYEMVLGRIPCSVANVALTGTREIITVSTPNESVATSPPMESSDKTKGETL